MANNILKDNFVFRLSLCHLEMIVLNINTNFSSTIRSVVSSGLTVSPKGTTVLCSRNVKTGFGPHMLLNCSAIVANKLEFPFRRSGANWDLGQNILGPNSNRYKRLAHSDPLCGVPRNMMLATWSFKYSERLPSESLKALANDMIWQEYLQSYGRQIRCSYRLYLCHSGPTPPVDEHYAIPRHLHLAPSRILNCIHKSKIRAFGTDSLKPGRPDSSLVFVQVRRRGPPSPWTNTTSSEISRPEDTCERPKSECAWSIGLADMVVSGEALWCRWALKTLSIELTPNVFRRKEDKCSWYSKIRTRATYLALMSYLLGIARL